MNIKQPYHRKGTIESRKGSQQTRMSELRSLANDKTGFRALEQQLKALKNENIKLRDELERSSRLARIDKLTQIGNRLSFGEHIKHIIDDLNEHKNNGKHPVVVLCDLDRFKGLNDGFGHDTGDAGLQAFSARMKKAMRRQERRAKTALKNADEHRSSVDRRKTNDLVIDDTLFAPSSEGYRLGGDEFVAILWIDADSEEEASKKMKLVDERLKKATSAMCFTHNNKSFPLVTSMGAHLIEKGDTAESAVKKADVALYQHKLDKGDRYEHTFNTLKHKGTTNLQYVKDHRGISLDDIPKYNFTPPNVTLDTEPS
ncbi:MAG: GGDEF domain-containing protein [Micavibrio sp.]|nr:GGDEF domain-containing protein [Micavibrio sp.]